MADEPTGQDKLVELTKLTDSGRLTFYEEVFIQDIVYKGLKYKDLIAKQKTWIDNIYYAVIGS